jgi:hypothetical protein
MAMLGVAARLERHAMIEVLAVGIATAFAGYLFLHPSRPRLLRTEIQRIRRISDRMRQSEAYSFE